ncbi:DUF763 domain-containing protein [Fulvivirga sediminis]|uniref:DUF763 domain-containing protein n=1 Tax=Fulvivirga sediminis TaxID=2803949 RepID=A0A937FAN7_9BACT|nr:DUF763 domain-containing protein [Fulvivirga sediminis]MBL3657103.1 DUF763 domain-containing protein [Fulvivirga sediminis]
MRRSGTADLPLHGGKVPYWLAKRMAELGQAIVESIVTEYGKTEFLSKISDPLWFQSFGCVLGMDWHSSGITTSVMGALKKSLNPIASDLGIYVCGGRGKHSRQTPAELLALADKTGINGDDMVHHSKLSAKVDNTAIQDGFQLYLHSFIVTDEGEWAVVQQGMNNTNGMARRYHWHSKNVRSFIEEPHTGVCGINKGLILNLTSKSADKTREGIMEIGKEDSFKMMQEARKIIMPRRHHVKKEDVNLKRLGSVLALANDPDIKTFDDLLLINGLGPRTLQSLTLVSEVIHGTPSRFQDPARFSFAHGGKDGHPFPVPTRIYDETISTLKHAVEKSKIGNSDKQNAIKKLHFLAQKAEKDFKPDESRFDKIIEKERQDSYKYGGRSVFGKSLPPKGQLDLFQ